MTAIASKSAADGKCRDTEIAATPAIAAPEPSYALAPSILINKSASARPSAGQTTLRVEPMKEELRSRKEPESLINIGRRSLIKVGCTLT
ncbi:MAG: hypothetical protein WAU56_03545, partial [Steroidobacteraceae bacterium]